MFKRTVSAVMLLLVVISTLTLAFQIQLVKGDDGTIYINADGRITPQTAPIQRNGDTYTLAGNINAGADGIVVERDNIVLNGAGYTETGSGSGTGIALTNVGNVTIRSMAITNFYFGICLDSSSESTLSGNNVTANCYGGIYLDSSFQSTLFSNNITNNWVGIYLISSCDNNLSGNDVMANSGIGIAVDAWSDNNALFGNDVTNNYYGIYLGHSCDNNLSGNSAANNDYGIAVGSSPSNFIFHNSFVKNANQVCTDGSINIWDDGSRGNYWSDYLTEYPNAAEVDSSGVWNTPYIINSKNLDRYPLMLAYASTSVVCSPNPVLVDSPVTCTATISGSNPTGTVNWSTSSGTGSFTQPVCTLSSGSCSTTYADTGPGNVTITASYSGDVDNMKSSGSGSAALIVFVSAANSATILGGNATVDQTSITGVSVNVTGSSAPDDTSLNITSANYGNAVPPSVTGAVTVGGAAFYDVQVSSNVTLGPDATAIIRITNPYFTSQDSVLSYWNGSSWIPVATQFFGPDTVCGNFSVSDLTGTPIMLRSSIAVMSVATAKTVVGQGYSLYINVTTADLGAFSVLSNVTVYANKTCVGMKDCPLLNGNVVTLTFAWNTTSWTFGNYTISVYAWPVPSETNTADNNMTGTVYVGIPGDINGDGTVDIYDAIILSGAFTSKPGDHNWNPNADINGDGIVDIFDAIILSGHFNQHLP